MLFKEIKPTAVLTGWCLSTTISARAAAVPFVNVLHSTSIQEYYQTGRQTWPDEVDFPFLRWFFSEEKLNALVNKRILQVGFLAKAYNVIGEKYGVKKFNNFVELIEGDYTLLADIPEWVGLPEVRPNIHHIGPLPAKINKAIPREIEEIPKDKP